MAQQELSAKHTPQPVSPRFLTKKQASEIYGGTIAWWDKVVWRKDIPHSKRGAIVVFETVDIEEYFKRRRVPARENAA